MFKEQMITQLSNKQFYLIGVQEQKPSNLILNRPPLRLLSQWRLAQRRRRTSRENRHQPKKQNRVLPIFTCSVYCAVNSDVIN